MAQTTRPTGSPPLPPNKPATGEPPRDGVDLMVNGGFEDADEDAENHRDGPPHWQKIDGLVFHWQRDPASPERGRVIRIDTDVDQKQAYSWWVKRYLHDAPLGDAPQKTQTVEPKYGTIAGLDGGFYWSDYIPIRPGRAYRVYVDAKGPASKVFIRGYDKELPLSFADESPAVQEVFREARGEPDVDSKGRPLKYRLRYRYTTWFPVGGSAEWKTYTHDRPRHPTGRELTEDVRFIRIVLYPYWPPGEYWYDNVRVYEVDPLPEGGKPKADEADVEEGKVIR
ncbi:MAG: hypothetical protein K8S99_18620 [Planctomycetes bacterium]|nr:hypothetical protein [Planctomycetota bacterium]